MIQRLRFAAALVPLLWAQLLWAALPTILINNSTGSNTAASGAGPSTAITGTSAAHTNGSGSTTITLTNTPDLSGVATDGSAVIYLATPSGRKFSKITAADNGADTVTVEDSFNIASGGSAVNYAIGGKRLDFEGTNEHTKQAFLDAKAGWTLEVQHVSGSYSLTSTIAIGTNKGDQTNGRIRIVGTGSTRPTITSATDSVALFTANDADYVELSNLILTHTASTRGAGISFITSSSNPFSVTSCLFDGCLQATAVTVAPTTIRLVGCEARNCTSTTAAFSTGGTVAARNCYVHDNAGDGIRGAFTDCDVADSVIVDNAGHGINSSNTATAQTIRVRHSTVAHNTSAGVNVGASGSTVAIDHGYSIFYGNGTYAIALGDSAAKNDANLSSDQYSAFGANSSGNLNNLTASSTAVALTSTPFVNKAADDYSLNAVAGAGAACRNVNTGFTLGGIPGDTAAAQFAAAVASSTISADVTKWSGTNVATPDTAGHPKVTIKSGTGTGEINLSSGNLAGSVASVAGAVGSVTGGVGGNVTGSVGSVVGAVGSVTGNVGGNVVGSVGSVTGAVGSVTGNVGGNVVGSVASVTAGVTLADGAITAAKIAADAITAAKVADGTIDAGTFAADALTASALSAGLVTEILTTAVPTSNTANTIGDCLNAARAQGFGKWSLNTGAKTLTLYAPDGSTAVATFDLDAVPNTTSRTPQ